MDLDRTAVSAAITADATPPEREASVEPSLVVSASPRADLVGSVFRLGEAAVVVGRDPSAALRLDDPGVSRRHATVAPRPGGGYVVSDLGSLNGTYVNGVRVRTAELADGDRIQIGTSTALRFAVRPLDPVEVRFRQAFAAGGLATWEWEAEARRLAVSAEGERMLALAPGDGARALGHVHADDRGALARALSGCLAGEGPVRLEVRIGGPCDAPRWVALRGEALVDAEGRPSRVAGTLEEITGRKSAELELRRQASMFENLSDGAVLLDPGGRIADWNRAAAGLFGWTRDEALGHTLAELLQPDEGAAFGEALADGVRNAGRYTRETRMRTRKGRVRELEVVAVPLAGPGAERLGTVVLHRDAGERKHLEARLMLAERLGALGTLTSGMAHEVNNPLAFLRSNLEYALTALDQVAAGDRPSQDEVRSALEDAHVGALRIQELVKDLRRFSRGEECAEPEPMDLNQAVQFGARVTANEVRHRAHLVLDLGQVPKVLGNETKLGQVVVNLLVNAARAIEEGASGEHEIRVTTRHDAAAGRVVLEVSDTGHGIPRVLQQRIFEPFFTTRPVGEGTGLGLAICHAIVAGAGGTLGVESEPGKGATFRVSLPAIEPRATTPAPAPLLTPPPIHGQVLVVDDEPLGAHAMRRLLEAQHEVTVAGSAAEALALIAAGRRFDAILSDVMMPEMSGIELLRRLTASCPDQARRVVFVTGGAFGDLTERALDAVPNRKLSKPCTGYDLARAVAEIARDAGPATASRAG